MSLKILVIGRNQNERPESKVDDGHEIQVANNTTLVFFESEDKDGTIRSADGFDFIIQHLSSEQLRPKEAVDTWRMDERVKSRIVGIAGGSLPDTYNDLELPCLEQALTRDDVVNLSWSKVPEDFEGDAIGLVGLLSQTFSIEHLAALSILAQGFLAAFAEPQVLGENEKLGETVDWGPVEISAALAMMQWPEFVGSAESSPVRNALTGVRDTVSSAEWWISALGVEVEELSVELEKEWGGARNQEPVQALVREVASGGRVRPGTVAGAYMALHTRLSGAT
jgi:hypothetical protein